MPENNKFKGIYEMLGGHTTILVLLIFFGIIYLPRFFKNPIESSQFQAKECTHAINVNLYKEEKCDALEQAFENVRKTLTKDDFANQTFVLARYNYLANRMTKAFAYCGESLPVWKTLANSWNGDSEYAKLKRNEMLNYAEQCEKMLKKQNLNN